MKTIFIVIFALINYVHCDSYYMMNPKPFVASPQISGDGHGFIGFNVADIGSNIYGSNQYKFGAQYTHKPIIWPGISNGLTQGFEVNRNRFETLKGNIPKNNAVNAEYGVASLNGFEKVKEYTPVFSGYGASSAYGYSIGKTGLQNSFISSDYNTQKQMSSGSGNVGRGFKYTNVMLPTQYITNENKPGMVRWYGNKVMISNAQKFNPSVKQQTVNVAPKNYGSISSANQGTHGQQSGNIKANGNSKFVVKVPEFSQNKEQQFMNVVSNDFTFSQMGNYGFDGYNGQQGFHGQQSGNTNSKLVGNVSQFSQKNEQQFRNVVPKDFTSNQMNDYGFGEQKFENSFQNTPVKTNGYSSGYSSVPSLESSLRDIYKMVNEEKRKSNGKAIFLVGQIEIPGQMSANLPGYSVPTSFSNTFNTFSGYKY